MPIGDMMSAGHTDYTCRIDAVHVGAVAARRHDAIGSEEEDAVEFLKLSGLFPPRVAIVSGKVRIFLENG